MLFMPWCWVFCGNNNIVKHTMVHNDDFSQVLYDRMAWKTLILRLPGGRTSFEKSGCLLKNGCRRFLAHAAPDRNIVLLAISYHVISYDSVSEGTMPSKRGWLNLRPAFEYVSEGCISTYYCCRYGYSVAWHFSFQKNQVQLVLSSFSHLFP